MPFTLGDCQVQTSFRISIPTHHPEGFVPTYFISHCVHSNALRQRCHHTGLHGWRGSSCINGSFFKGLTLQLAKTYCPPPLLLGEAYYTVGLMGFPSLFYFLMRGVETCSDLVPAFSRAPRFPGFGAGYTPYSVRPSISAGLSSNLSFP